MASTDRFGGEESSDLPTGTVTFLFTDIEGSTRLAQTHGSVWPSLLEEHRRLVGDACAGHGGREFGAEGDALFLAFGDAPAALLAAAAAQRALAGHSWPSDAVIRVRMGLHTGAAARRGHGYAGFELHRAARIAAAGHGGQVLFSEATRVLADSALPDGIGIRDLGDHRLKDLLRPEHLYQLLINGLPADFPPIRSLEPTESTLPVQLTTFLGRTRELEEIDQSLRGTRLLTLTGPGGTGKTRLALEAAARQAGSFPDGVVAVLLGSIREPDLVAATIAQQLGLPDRGGRSPVDRIVEHLRHRRVLLVLDNFEQVLPAAPLVTQLLAQAPALTVVVTSRSALRLYGEREYPVGPMGVPDLRRLPPLEVLSRYEAIALFVERARAVRPEFTIGDQNAAAVAEICYRLEGLPLAIELAAARVKVLPIASILDRLGQRLSLLAGGARDLPARQQTLRGAIAWSHDLLDKPDRQLFASLSVFVGGASLEAVETLTAADGDGDVLDGLGSLIDKSLLRQGQGVDGEPRFTMLETIREFATERLVESGREEELRERHAELFLALVEQAGTFLLGSDKRRWLDRLETEHDNLRAALTCAIASVRPAIALRLVRGLWRFWQMRGYLVEGMERTEAALAMPGSADDPPLRATALEAAGGLAYWQADMDRARRWYHEGMELLQRLGDASGVANALYNLSFTHFYARDAGPSDILEGRRLGEEALRHYRAIGDRAGIAKALWGIANSYVGGAPAEALRSGEEALALFRELDDQFMVGWSLYTNALGEMLLGKGDPHAHIRESLQIFVEAEDVSGYTLVLDFIAQLALVDGDAQLAARISGAVSNLEATTGTGLNFVNRRVLTFEPRRLRDDPATAAAWADGERSPLAEVVRSAREWLEGR